MTDVTMILCAIEQGDPAAAQQLLPLVYEELRRLAAQKMANENPGQTLQATALVHEAYLRLVGGAEDRRWDSRGHFFAAAAEAMRRILIEHARQRQSAKRGGGLSRKSLDEAIILGDEVPDDLLALDEALTKLAAIEPQGGELVKLRYFAGLTLREVASILEISPRTADSLWAYCKAWLYNELADAND